jgi:predicted DNA-binding transcriptional regulator AlpA
MLAFEPWVRRGGSRSSHYKAIRDGLMTPGVRAAGRQTGWPPAELAAIDVAIASGASQDTLRDLVQRLVQQREEAAGKFVADLDSRAAAYLAQYAPPAHVAPDDLLTPEEGREVINVGETKFNELSKREDFPRAVQFGSRTRRYVRSELVAWAHAQRECSGPTQACAQEVGHIEPVESPSNCKPGPGRPRSVELEAVCREPPGD